MSALDSPLQPGRQHQVTVSAEDGGQRIDRLLAAALPELSRSRIKGLIETGMLTRGGATIEEPSYRVKPGQTFAIFIPELREAEPEGQAMALTILYEDNEVIVLDKPAGLVVHPAPGNPDRTLVNALIAHCGESLRGIGGVRRPGIVHRLDKDTSGVMVAAKTDAAHQGLAAQFADRSIERSYLALVWGRPRQAEGKVDAPIGRSPRNRRKMAVVSRGGKTAITLYKVLDSYSAEAVSLVECRLLTGRTHQIRVHMTEVGHPLVGDPLYGRASRERQGRLPAIARTTIKALGRQALHAQSLGFKHPASGKFLKFETALPTDMSHLILTLESLKIA